MTAAYAFQQQQQIPKRVQSTQEGVCLPIAHCRRIGIHARGNLGPSLRFTKSIPIPFSLPTLQGNLKCYHGQNSSVAGGEFGSLTGNFTESAPVPVGIHQAKFQRAHGLPDAVHYIVQPWHLYLSTAAYLQVKQMVQGIPLSWSRNDHCRDWRVTRYGVLLEIFLIHPRQVYLQFSNK